MVATRVTAAEREAHFFGLLLLAKEFSEQLGIRLDVSLFLEIYRKGIFDFVEFTVV